MKHDDGAGCSKALIGGGCFMGCGFLAWFVVFLILPFGTLLGIPFGIVGGLMGLLAGLQIGSSLFAREPRRPPSLEEMLATRPKESAADEIDWGDLSKRAKGFAIDTRFLGAPAWTWGVMALLLILLLGSALSRIAPAPAPKAAAAKRTPVPAHTPQRTSAVTPPEGIDEFLQYASETPASTYFVSQPSSAPRQENPSAATAPSVFDFSSIFRQREARARDQQFAEDMEALKIFEDMNAAAAENSPRFWALAKALVRHPSATTLADKEKPLVIRQLDAFEKVQLGSAAVLRADDIAQQRARAVQNERYVLQQIEFSGNSVLALFDSLDAIDKQEAILDRGGTGSQPFKDPKTGDIGMRATFKYEPSRTSRPRVFQDHEFDEARRVMESDREKVRVSLTRDVRQLFPRYKGLVEREALRAWLASEHTRQRGVVAEAEAQERFARDNARQASDEFKTAVSVAIRADKASPLSMLDLDD